MSVDGRAKGKRGELEVMRLIRDWWQRAEPNSEFARTPGSGGWQGRGSVGQNLRGEFRMSGDLMTTSHNFPFSVEVKLRESWSYERLVGGGASPIWGWWEQCRVAAAESNLVPMLWLRKNRMDWLVMLPRTYCEQLCIRPPRHVWTYWSIPAKAPVTRTWYVPALFSSDVVLKVTPGKLITNERSKRP